MTLRERQTWLQAVITHPGGVAAGLDGADPAVMVTRSRALTETQRLAVYGNAYQARLLECFRAEYPALRHALGDEVFTGFVADYLTAHPPRSHTLHDLTARFPRHLADTAPAGEDWPGFIVDLASLERTFAEVFDGPGREGRPDGRAAVREALRSGECQRVRTAPDLRLMTVRYPVGRYLVAVRRGEQPDLPAPARAHLAVYRHDYAVRLLELAPEEFRTLAALSAGNGASWRDEWVELGFLVPA